MRKLTLSILAGAAALALPSTANATITLVMGDNALTTQIHALNGQPTTGLLVQGVTNNPDGTIVNFSSPNAIQITGGGGYAAISDAPSAGAFQSLTIALANGGVFTGYEFSIMFLNSSVSNQQPGNLLISYVEGDGTTGFFSVGGTSGSEAVAGASVLANLSFGNPNNRDFRLIATNGESLRSITLSTGNGTGGGAQFFEQKQNDINLVVPSGVPEPGTWAMMLMGFGAIGFSVRRKRGASLLQAA